MLDDNGLERFENQEGTKAGVPINALTNALVSDEEQLAKLIARSKRAYVAHMKKLDAIGYNYSGLPTRRSINRE